MTDEEKRYVVIGKTAYKFVRSVGWTSEQIALLYELFCELGLQYDLTETPNSAAELPQVEPAPKPTLEPAPTPEPMPEPELMSTEALDTAALKKEARVLANALGAKDRKARRNLIKQYGGETIDTIPVDKLPDFIATIKEMLK